MTTNITPLDAANISPGTGGTIPIGKELNVASRAVNGGTVYITTVRDGNSDPVGVSSAFVPANVSAPLRTVELTNAVSDAGVQLTATATSGAMGISRSAGVSLVLVGEATSSSAKTDKAAFEVILPATYVAGSAITFNVDANYTGSGTVTAASTTVLVNPYVLSNTGGETLVTVTQTATQFVASAAQYPFAVTAAAAAAANLVPGSRLMVEVVMVVTTSAGAATGQINSLTYNA